MYNCRRRFLFIPFVIGGIFLITWVVMTLWNHILPDVIHVSPITYWQALGIFLLSKILFGGFRGGCRGRGGYWKQHLQEKMSNMTEEEKLKFKHEWQQRWRSCRPFPSSNAEKTTDPEKTTE